MKPDIFISYKREDVGMVRALAKELVNCGWTVWWDHDIPAGKDYDTEILNALTDAKCVIVIWSEKSIYSRNVKDEANVGLERGVLIPILVGNVKAPIGFRMIQSVIWNDNDLVERDELNNIIYQVKLMIGKPTSEKETANEIETKPGNYHPEGILEITSQKSDAGKINEPQQTELNTGDLFTPKKKFSGKSFLIIAGIVIALLAALLIFKDKWISQSKKSDKIPNVINTDSGNSASPAPNTDTLNGRNNVADSIAEQKAKDSIANANLLARQKAIKDSLDKLPDSLIREAVFNLQRYATAHGIKRTAVNSNNEPNTAFEFTGVSDAITIPGLLTPVVKSKKLSVVVAVRPGSANTGAIISAMDGYYGFYLGLEQNRPRVDIFYGSYNHAVGKNFSGLKNVSWNLIFFTYSFNDIRLRVNDGSVSKDNSYGHDISFKSNQENFVIGGKAIYSGQVFTGSIGNVLLYDRCITKEEMDKLYSLYKENKLNKTL